MLLIVAKEFDYFTDCVCDWLINFGLTDIIRINENDRLFVEEINLATGKIILSVNSRMINFDDIKMFWNRGGNLPVPAHDWQTEDAQLAQQVRRFIYYEWNALREYLFYILQQKSHIDNFFLGATNKLRNLNIARECGLSVPDTIIAQKNFKMRLTEKSKYIIKPISECIPFSVEGRSYRLYNKGVEQNCFENDSHTYFPSLIQSRMDVDFEIRVFAIAEVKEFYAMAVFCIQSENDADYRKYYDSNRHAPYLLPEQIKEKLLRFMSRTELDTASFDLIKTREGEYIFLEVNPFGNIEMINETCGYGIDRRLAEIICHKYSSIL